MLAGEVGCVVGGRPEGVVHHGGIVVTVTVIGSAHKIRRYSRALATKDLYSLPHSSPQSQRGIRFLSMPFWATAVKAMSIKDRSDQLLELTSRYHSDHAGKGKSKRSEKHLERDV